MTLSRKILLLGGLLLALWGMSYGLYYALFDEHQTLVRMGERLTAAFSLAAEKKMPESSAALAAYARARYEYVREVDVHSHWSGLALLLILLGVMFDQVAFAEGARRWLAVALVAGSCLFPLGVFLQIFSPGLGPTVIAGGGAGLLVVALAVVAAGFARSTSRGPAPKG